VKIADIAPMNATTMTSSTIAKAISPAQTIAISNGETMWSGVTLQDFLRDFESHTVPQRPEVAYSTYSIGADYGQSHVPDPSNGGGGPIAQSTITAQTNAVSRMMANIAAPTRI
jgi:hypothetical protein